MKMISMAVLLTALHVSMGCKRAFSPQTRTESAASTPGQDLASTQGKPDKTSEEPTGIPGYPLLCQWAKAPVPEDSEARFYCFLADKDKRPVTTVKDVIWEFTNRHAAVQVRLEAQPDGRQLLVVKGSTTDAVLLAVQDLELVARYQFNGPIVTRVSGRDFIKSEPGRLRFSSQCGSLLTIIQITESGDYRMDQIPRFDGCEILASSLLNVSVPDPTFRSLPRQGRTLLATCTDTILLLSVNQAVYQGSNQLLILSSAEACQDLAALISAQAI